MLHSYGRYLLHGTFTKHDLAVEECSVHGGCPWGLEKPCPSGLPGIAAAAVREGRHSSQGHPHTDQSCNLSKKMLPDLLWLELCSKRTSSWDVIKMNLASAAWYGVCAAWPNVMLIVCKVSWGRQQRGAQYLTSIWYPAELPHWDLVLPSAAIKDSLRVMKGKT